MYFLFYRLLTQYNVQICYVSPPSLEMPSHIFDYVASKGINQEKFQSLEDVLPNADVVYMTRIQRERFSSAEEYEKVSIYSSFLNTIVIFISLVFYEEVLNNCE